jgi:predicted transcriptional regulator
MPENPGQVTFRANKAGDFMSTAVISIADNAPLQEAIVLLTDKGLHAAPVIDVAGRPVGVISPSDLLIHEREKRSGDTAPVLVRDVMTPGVIAVATDGPMHKVVEELRANQVRQVFVVDKAGVLVGSISALDVLKQLQFDCD